MWEYAFSPLHAGHREYLKKRVRGIVFRPLWPVIGAGAWLGFPYDASAGGETRTLSLYHVHTKESLTVTYKVNGRYIPSALEKINRLMRDWRRNEIITIDPKTIDLMWELHADLGSSRPIHIICGYRSPKTNAFLKRIGRNVARKSQHMLGKAIDLYFPDVPTEKIRNSALVRQIGGVGYYRSSRTDRLRPYRFGPGPPLAAHQFQDGQDFPRLPHDRRRPAEPPGPDRGGLRRRPKKRPRQKLPACRCRMLTKMMQKTVDSAPNYQPSPDAARQAVERAATISPKAIRFPSRVRSRSKC